MSEAPTAIQAHFLAALPRIEAVAEYCFRHIAPEAREEKVAETIALAWKHYASLVDRGKNPDEFISTLAERSAQAVKAGRRLAGSEPMKDVTSLAAQKRRGFTVQSLPEVDNSPHEHDTLDALIDHKAISPAKAAELHIDYPAWLSRFKPVKRAILVDAAMEEDTKELSRVYALSQGRISQIRKEAFEDWQTFHASKEPGQAPEVERCR